MGKIYWIAILICLLGFLILIQEVYNHKSNAKNSNIGFCIIKSTTNFPCPSCGSTRAVLLLLKGNLIDSIKLNPVGILIAGFLIFIPFVIVYDIIFGKKILEKIYNKSEQVLKNKKIFIGLIVVIIINWIWNIKKGL